MLSSAVSKFSTCSIIALIVLLSSSQPQLVDGANILGLFTSNSPSHLIVHMSIMKALAAQGHNITVVTVMKPKVMDDRINLIVIPPSAENWASWQSQVELMTKEKISMIKMFYMMLSGQSPLTKIQADVLMDDRFKELHRNPDTKFDLLVLGYFMNEFQLGMGALFNCPVVVSWMAPPMALVNNLVGNPEEVSYVPNLFVILKPGEQMTILKRAQNVFVNVMMNVFQMFYDRSMEHYYRSIYPVDRGDFPTFVEMTKNVSLVLCNSHFSEGPIRPNVPAIVEIGGIQIKEKPSPLPADIATFLNNTNARQHGAVLFSLGSNVQSKSVKPETIKNLFASLSGLKQNVIWKWEDLDNVPGKMPHIMYKKWVPQDDILAHPNLKLFITHAGKGGLAEAQYHGVPMVALPIFGDQESNAQKLTESGYGKFVHLLELKDSQQLTTIIEEVLQNPRYAENVRAFSQKYRDRPLTARQTAVYWIEYILRHHGAPHLQSPLVHLNTIQQYNLDVKAVLLVLAYLLWRILKCALKTAYSLLCRMRRYRTNQKVKKQ